MGLSGASLEVLRTHADPLMREDDLTGKWKMANRPLIVRTCARGWLPRFSALLAWRGGERRMQRKQCVKSSPPLFRLRDVTLGGSTRAWRGGSRSRAAGGRDPRATWRHGQDLRATGRHDLWLRVQGYMFNQTLGNRFNQSLEGGHAPQQLADMTVGYLFN